MSRVKILRVRKTPSALTYTKHKHVRKGDLVMVIAGDSKGTLSKVSQVIGGTFVRLANVFQTKTKKNEQKKEEVVKQHRKIHISNVMQYDESINKISRIFYKLDENGKKSRFYRTSSNPLPMSWVRASSDKNKEITEEEYTKEMKEEHLINVATSEEESKIDTEIKKSVEEDEKNSK